MIAELQQAIADLRQKLADLQGLEPVKYEIARQVNDRIQTLEEWVKHLNKQTTRKKSRDDSESDSESEHQSKKSKPSSSI